MPLKGEFVFDSSVVLSYVFDNPRYRHRLAKLQRDITKNQIRVSVTLTIVNECEGRIYEIIKFIRQTISSLYAYLRGLRNGTSTGQLVTIGPEAYLQIQDFFLAQANSLTMNSETSKEKLEHIETLVVEFLESRLKTQAEIRLDLFLAGCLKEVGKMRANMDAELGRYRLSSLKSEGNPNFAKTIQSKLTPKPSDNDALILTEIQAARVTGTNFVLVATDYKELVRSAPQIATLTGVPVSDPLYAIHKL